jgi:ketosteroid isomerase-like protein
MTIDTEEMEIKAVLEAVRKGHHDKDAAAIGAQYTPDAAIFDLAPPLAHMADISGLAAWLDTWEGPVGLEERDLTIEVSGGLAFCHGLSKVSATTKADGQRAQWWQRITVCLRRTEGAWKIVHEHASVPFYMDGSYRAAIDLEP